MGAFAVAPLPPGPPCFLLMARLLGDKGVREFKVQGTPTFVINGVMQENTSSWGALKPKLMDAGA